MEMSDTIKIGTRVKVFLDDLGEWKSGRVREVDEERDLYTVHLDENSIVKVDFVNVVEEEFLEFLFAREGYFGNWSALEGWLWAIAMSIILLFGLFSSMGSIWFNILFCIGIMLMVFVVFNEHYKNFIGKKK